LDVTDEEQERKELCAELAGIESDLTRQLIRVYRRGIDYREFWELVDRLRAFSEMRKNICGG